MAGKENGRPLPKFGEWDVNDPSSAESFTVIFNKARNEKKYGTAKLGSGSGSTPKANNNTKFNHQTTAALAKSHYKKWFCCMYASGEP